MFDSVENLLGSAECHGKCDSLNETIPESSKPCLEMLILKQNKLLCIFSSSVHFTQFSNEKFDVQLTLTFLVSFFLFIQSISCTTSCIFVFHDFGVLPILFLVNDTHQKNCFGHISSGLLFRHQRDINPFWCILSNTVVLIQSVI